MPTDTLAERIAEMKAAAEKATPGPWGFHGLSTSYHIARVEGSYHCSPRVVHATLGGSVYDADNLETGAGGVRKYEDAKYIALADPTTILALLAHVEQLEREVERVTCRDF